MTYNAVGIILNYRDVGEFDRIYNILTYENGRVDAWAQGVRKPKSKLVAHLQLLYLCDFMFARGRKFDRIAQVQIKNRFPDIWKDLATLSKAVYVTSLVELVVKPGTKEPMIFELLNSAMNLLGKGNCALEIMFAIKMLKETGFSPELHHCVLCKTRVEGITRSFDAIRGGVLCSGCFIKAGAEAIPVSSLTLETIDTILTSPLTRLEMPETLINEMRKLVDTMVHAHFGEDPKALAFMRAISRDQVRDIPIPARV